MNLDVLRVQRYKEVRGERKKYGSKVNSYCDSNKPSQAGEDRNNHAASLGSKQDARKLHRKSLTEGSIGLEETSPNSSDSGS